MRSSELMAVAVPSAAAGAWGVSEGIVSLDLLVGATIGVAVILAAEVVLSVARIEYRSRKRRREREERGEA